MKNTIKRIAAVMITGAGLALAGAGTAHADLGDEVGFLGFLTNEGLYMVGPNQAGRMLASGYWVCQSRASHSALDLVDFVYHNTDESVTFRQSAAIVAASETFLCPVYSGTPANLPGIAPAPAPAPAPFPIV
jgi:hypothetical protein